ncbi:MAG: DUF3164 family protein [Methylobacter sp.]|uniref:DUF3164 family protein n=1 Tax=Methylobacter sp. TaxID=2051955 RepID=UPI002730A3E5|nr:DUF3164 family protein [Methylobacter sp.]MDP1664103.1 DUF3164 family protein [Methylobacter sp.]
MHAKDLIKNSVQKIKDLYEHIAEIKQDPAVPMMKDSKGRHCPVDIIKDIDLARDRLVNNRNTRAQELSQLIEAFKAETFADIDAFIEVSNSEHAAKIGVASENGKRKAWKGNIQLINYAGTEKVSLKINDKIAFNEKLNNAMEKLQDLIKAHSSDIDEIIKVLINEAFRVDKTGFIDTQKVLELRRYKIDHPVWKSAMDDIAESIQIVGSKSYLQFFHRETPEAEWQGIALDIARL